MYLKKKKTELFYAFVGNMIFIYQIDLFMFNIF